MNEEKEKIKNNQRKIIGIEPVIDMKHFVELLLADLASKSSIIDLDNKKIKTACLSSDYKKIIEEIMYQENDWVIRFATLINIYSYYEFQAEWEQKLIKTITKVLKEMNKELVYDLKTDMIKITFTTEEIETIKKQYDDETLANMNHFTNLINSGSSNRKEILDRRDKLRLDARYAYKLEEAIKKTLCKNSITLGKKKKFKIFK